MNIVKHIIIILIMAVAPLTFSQTDTPSSSGQVLLDTYNLEFLENNEDYIRLSYEVADFYDNTLSKITKTRALTPTELDYFYHLVKRVLKNDRERSYLELKLRVLSDLNLGKRFYEESHVRSLTLLWAATEMIGQNVFNYVFAPIYQNKKFRRMILSGHNANGLRKSKVERYFKKYFNNKRIKRLSNFLKKFMREKSNFVSLLDVENNDEYLFQIIETSEKKLKIRKSTAIKRRLAIIKFYLKDVTDIINIGANDIFSELSGGFGNAVGRVKWRSGRLKRSNEAVGLVKETLKPLDILVEKTPFILTDYLIPGHFGHIALYLGTREQLEELNMWNHPKIRPFHSSIMNGKVILEAKRDGVQLSTIDEFLNVDELAILRAPEQLSSNYAHHNEEVYNRAIQQIGKAYDFNFDVETSDEIVCSELIYQTYYFIDWRLEKTMGRWTISPDNIVQEIFQEKPRIDLILYLKGQLGSRYKRLTKKDLQKVIES